MFLLVRGIHFVEPIGDLHAGCEVHRLCAGGRFGQAFQDLDGIGRFRPYGVVSVDVGGANYPRPIDYEARRHRQRPGFISVKLFQVNPEGEVDFAQILRELMNQVELARHPIAGIAQQLQIQPLFVGKPAVEFFELR